ncbi:MAG: zf-HC2 domain-containing protein [Actinobacteria bacterium]|nr:zf-HC2 domain-containing protein [Actinomycetota bacterium]
MTASDHERFHRDLGVYVLGGLDPGERDAFERHLATCDACRDDLADLAVLPALLSRLPVSDDVDAVVPPPVEPVLERIAAERRQARRRSRLLAVAAAVASVVAAVALVLSATAPAGTVGQEYLAADRTATATVESRGWGMEVTIRAADLPVREGYTAYAVRDDGHRAQVASWSATGRPIELRGACYLEAEDVSHIEIVAARSDEVVSLLEPGPVAP